MNFFDPDHTRPYLDRLPSLGRNPRGPRFTRDLHPHPYVTVTRWSEMHWDGSARRRNVESVTDRVGNR